MTRAELINEIKTKKTFLCVGLDPDVDKIPQFLLEEEDPIFEFNRQIVDATADAPFDINQAIMLVLESEQFRPPQFFNLKNAITKIITIEQEQRFYVEYFNIKALNGTNDNPIKSV